MEMFPNILVVWYYDNFGAIRNGAKGLYYQCCARALLSDMESTARLAFYQYVCECWTKLWLVAALALA